MKLSSLKRDGTLCWILLRTTSSSWFNSASAKPIMAVPASLAAGLRRLATLAMSWGEEAKPGGLDECGR
eukprot:CAMPEP_0183440964 /NCGR_PEP_ID=MMETSP0370-20130417/83298_1 /TAXON_ID=268820 /ORGANISM="Peridinium aciculiferum, Strain PAER-2" /LENGTH=68 /DNA_ID=CAMNT_0025630025 /DNA_START=13 /DNA_END=216 /DNA_ORIENTATION=-